MSVRTLFTNMYYFKYWENSYLSANHMENKKYWGAVQSGHPDTWRTDGQTQVWMKRSLKGGKRRAVSVPVVKADARKTQK